MSKKYEITAIFKINQSSMLIKWLIALHALAMVSVFLTSLVLAYKALLLDAIFFSLLFYLGKEINFDGITIRHNSINGWDIAQLSDIYQPVEILSSTVMTPYLVVLHFKLQNKQKKTILICKDALTTDNYRKLMVALSISGLKKEDI